MSAVGIGHAGLAKLIEYWLGELAPGEEEALEEHLFGCKHCTEHLEELAMLAQGIRTAFAGGALHAVLSAAFLEAMKARGLRVREYRVAPGGSVQCTLRAEDDAVISRLAAPLAGVRRLDLVRLGEGGDELRLTDIPFDAEAGEVLFCPSAAHLRTLPAHTDRVRLVAVEEAGEREIGEYTFLHTPG